MNSMSIKDKRVTVAKSFYIAGVTEDGLDYEAECYNVVITAKDGSRWSHDKTWYTAEPTEDNINGFTDTRETSFGNAQAFANVVEKVGIIGMEYWKSIEPVYGSESYVIIGE